ncbi:MAG: hypothetical protein FJX72_01960 [Armatimonadetes bacterium]|nr:hypothetical protein [Armatimonadota bacterium]
MAKRKSWQEKLDQARAKAPAPCVMQCDKTGQMFVIPGVPELEEMVRAVPAGAMLSIDAITDRLRERHAVAFACPMTTGIFLWLLAHAAHEKEALGDGADYPWWRVVKKGGALNPKYPGLDLQRTRLMAEGHRIVDRGKQAFVTANPHV